MFHTVHAADTSFYAASAARPPSTATASLSNVQKTTIRKALGPTRARGGFATSAAMRWVCLMGRFFRPSRCGLSAGLLRDIYRPQRRGVTTNCITSSGTTGTSRCLHFR